jgi:hypothetical protein
MNRRPTTKRSIITLPLSNCTIFGANFCDFIRTNGSRFRFVNGLRKYCFMRSSIAFQILHFVSTSFAFVGTFNTVVFFSMARQPLRGQGLLIVEASRSHSDTPHSVEPVAETSTWLHTTLTRDRHPCPGGIFFLACPGFFSPLINFCTV